MKGFHWRVDKRKLASVEVHKAAVKALGDAADYILETANRTAPIEEGTLIRSGDRNQIRTSLRCNVFYDTPYARRQHEDTRNRHDSGRRAKWLEKTFREEEGKVREMFKDAISKAMR